MASLFEIGKTGVQAYRQALSVTGQNIANINTEGYNKRRADVSEVAGVTGGPTNVSDQSGLGVRVSNVRRSFDAYLGFMDGNPVAAGSLFIKHDVAGVYNVCVSPEARKRRFGEMVTRHLLDIANQQGCSMSVLQSSPMALRLYEKVGFQRCGSFRLFLLDT